MAEKMLPVMPDGSKIVILTSAAGTFAMVPGVAIKDKLSDKALTREGVKKIAEEYSQEVREKKEPFKDGPFPVYCMSKLLLNVYAKILSKEEQVKKRGIQIYTCHPGWVKTDMGGPMAPMSIEEGTMCPCFLINLPWKIDEAFQGEFFCKSVVTPL